VIDTASWVMFALGLAAAGVRRRSVAIALVGAQATALAAAALAAGTSPGDYAFGVLLLLRGLALAAGLGYLVLRSRQRRPVQPGGSATRRMVVAGGLALATVALVPDLGVGTPGTTRAALGLVMIGIAILALRRALLFQVLGLLVAENGLGIGAVGLPGGLPMVVEMGVLFDLVLVVAVAAAFHQRIFSLLGEADTALLARLRD
jgi:hydrogenase-4 component E